MMKDVRRALEDEKIRQQELGVRCTTVIDGYTDFAFSTASGNPTIRQQLTAKLTGLYLLAMRRKWKRQRKKTALRYPAGFQLPPVAAHFLYPPLRD